MSDIFISYSRQDAEQAQLLTELLESAGSTARKSRYESRIELPPKP